MDAAQPNIAAWRTEMRVRLMAARAAVPFDARQRNNERITRTLLRFFPQLAQLTIGLYWPMRAEFDPRDVGAAWRAHGARVALPIASRGAALGYREWSLDMDRLLDPLAPAAANGACVVQPDAYLVPAVGFDLRGFCLGYGGAYFDRTLAQHDPPPLKIGIAHELSRLNTIHPLRHDIPMHFIVTEHGVHEVAAAGLRLLTDPAQAAPAIDAILEVTRARSREDLAALLNLLLESERAGAKVLSAYGTEPSLPPEAHAVLLRVQRDERDNCATLTRLLRALGVPCSRNTAGFLRKALAVRGARARLECLNRAQAWVARKIEEAIPRITEPGVRATLAAMLDSHVTNIGRCERLIASLPVEARAEVELAPGD